MIYNIHVLKGWWCKHNVIPKTRLGPKCPKSNPEQINCWYQQGPWDTMFHSNKDWPGQKLIEETPIGVLRGWLDLLVAGVGPKLLDQHAKRELSFFDTFWLDNLTKKCNKKAQRPGFKETCSLKHSNVPKWCQATHDIPPCSPWTRFEQSCSRPWAPQSTMSSSVTETSCWT